MTQAVLPMLLLGLSMGAETPESLSITTDVQTWRAQAVADDVSDFLGARVYEAWGLRARETGAQFSVRLTWPAPERVQISVHQGDRRWVDRPLPVDDPGAARAMVWLLVRSTIERALVHAAAPRAPELALVDPTPPIPRRAPPAVPQPVLHTPAPATPELEVALADEDPDAAWLAPEAPTATATAAQDSLQSQPPATPAVPEPPAPTTSSIHPAAGPTGLRRLWSAPFALAEGDAVEAAVLMRGFADPSSGFGWGPAMQARLVLAEHWVVGGELGYQSERKGEGLDVDHVPLTLLAGYRFSRLPIEAGISATLDTRVVTARGGTQGADVETTGVTAGLLLGAYGRGYYSLWQRGGDELRVFGELATRFGALRSAYVVGGERQQDAVVSFSTGLGLEWRWR